MGMVKKYAEIPKNHQTWGPFSILQGTFGDPALRALRHWVQLWVGLKMIFFQHFNFNGNLWELYMSRKTIYMYIFWTEARDGEAISRHPIKICKGNSEIPSSHLHARWPGGPILPHSVLSKNAWAYRHITQWRSHEKTCWFVHQIWCSLGWSEPWSMNSKYLP